MQRRALLATAALALAACSDHPLRPDIAGPEAMTPPQLAVATLGVTELPTLGGNSNGALAINAVGQVAGLTAISGAQAAARWEGGALRWYVDLAGYTSLGTARGINAAGDMVGSSRTSSGKIHATLWRNGGGIVDLLAFNGDSSEAHDINDAGQVVGTSKVITPTGAVEIHAFLWQNGGMVDLGSLGGPHAGAHAINNRGQIVGFSWTASGEIHGFLWENGQMYDLGTLGGTFSNAIAINEAGQIVGVSYETAGGEPRATIWENRTPRALSPGYGLAYGINDLGQVIGLSSGAGGRPAATLWIDGVPHVLGTPDGLANSIARDINNHGQVVGSASSPGSPRIAALLWDVPIAAQVDVDPASSANAVRLGGSDALAVAVLTNPYFNAATIDPKTVTLGNEDGSDTPVARRRTGEPQAVLKDADRDGDRDLVLTFSKGELVRNGDLAATTTKLVLLGRRADARAIRGAEQVTVAP